MIKYILLIVSAATCLAIFTNHSTRPMVSAQDSTFVLDSTLISNFDSNIDSFTKSLTASDKAVVNKIDKTSEHITELKEVIKQKDNQINELKNTINEYNSPLDTKFRLLAVDSQDRK